MTVNLKIFEFDKIHRSAVKGCDGDGGRARDVAEFLLCTLG